MGTALTGLEIKDTYEGLIKTTDNGDLTGSLKVLTDGSGNDSALSLSTAGASVAGSLALRSAALATAATQILVVNGDPSSTTRDILTRTPAQIRSDIGAGTGDGTVTGTGTSNFVSKFTSASAIGNSSIFDNGDVGIGNSAPTAKLDVTGTLAVSGNATFDTNTLFVDAANNRVGVGTITPLRALSLPQDSYIGFGNGDATRPDFQLGYNSTESNLTIRAGFGSDATDIAINTSGNVGIGTDAPATTLDVLGTSFLRGNVNAGKTANINVTTAVNGTGGGNRDFDTFTGASATGFTGTDATDQGHGYFAATIVSGRSYEVSATMVVTNGNPLSFITSTGLNFATDTVQTVESVPASNTTYRFVATGNASFFGISASNDGGGMTCVVSNFSLKEVGSVLVTSDSNVGVGTTAPAVKLDVVGNIRSSTGILFGTDTAAANALDDYEEGTWTMGISFGGASAGVTTDENTGTYTKIGRQVTVNGLLFLTSKGSSTGIAKITGLPFTIPNNSANYSSASLLLNEVTFTNQFQGFGVINTTTINLEEITILGAVTSLTNADFANNSAVIVSLTYFV